MQAQDHERQGPQTPGIGALIVLAIGLIASSANLLACYPKGWSPKPDLRSLSASPFHVGPYLVPLAQGRIAVVVKEELNAAPEVDWWIGGTQTASTSSAAATMSTVIAQRVENLWVAVLEPLPPDVQLAYRVRSSAGDVGPFEFRGGVSRGKPFRFAAFGDTRTGHEIHRDLIEQMARESIEFVINSGDLVEFGGNEDQWDLFFAIESPLVTRRPVFAAIGNHDLSPRRHFEKFFLLDSFFEKRRYFSIDWGDLRVVLLDSESEMRKGSEQYAFVEAALADGAEKGMLMAMSLHYPPYSSGAHGSNLEMREVIGELAPRFGVELVLAGHDHDYERTKPIDGVTYIVAASAGATIRRIAASKFTEVLRTEPHFVLFDVERGSLVGRTVNRAGEVFDSFVVPDNPPRGGR